MTSSELAEMTKELANNPNFVEGKFAVVDEKDDGSGGKAD